MGDNEKWEFLWAVKHSRAASMTQKHWEGVVWQYPHLCKYIKYIIKFMLYYKK
jgi:hypothetical protein